MLTAEHREKIRQSQLGHVGYNRTHGMNGTRTYKSWTSMIQRCINPKAPNWKNYGGRGITVCARWLHSFESFFEDMGERPEDKTLDRYPDHDGNYELSNCRWATPKEQAANRRPPKRLTFCRKGLHELTGAGVKVSASGRHCRKCVNASRAALRLRKKTEGVGLFGLLGVI